jgi:hypothetical protein
MTETDRERLMEISRYCASENMGTYAVYLRELAGSEGRMAQYDETANSVKQRSEGMTPDQGEKFAYKYQFYHGKELQEGEKNIFRAGYEACLEANGIGEDGRRMDMFQGCRHYAGETTGSTSGPNGYPRTSNHSESVIPTGYFKIGEEVEFRSAKQKPGELEQFRTGKVIMISSPSGAVYYKSDDLEVRRIPAWKPTDGQAVLFCLDGTAWAGVVSGDDILSKGACMSLNFALNSGMVKPFVRGGNAKPWSEI